MESNYEHEYSETLNYELDYYSRIFFKVPFEIIADFNMGDQRLAVFTYISMRRGIDYKVKLAANDLVLYIGKTPDRHPGKINSKIQHSIDCLHNKGYIDPQSNDVFQTFSFNDQKVQESKKYAIVYIDEIDRIINSSYSNKDILLLVFAYLKMKIIKRKNQFSKTKYKDKIDYRKRHPEVYNGYYSEMVKDLGISAHVIKKAAETLAELGLIYIEELPRKLYRSSNGQDRWMTNYTLFCGTYKRERIYQFAKGRDYYMEEVKNKKAIINGCQEGGD